MQAGVKRLFFRAVFILIFISEKNITVFIKSLLDAILIVHAIC